MSWQTFVGTWQQCPMNLKQGPMNLMQASPEIENTLTSLADADPGVYWYPGSGSDLTPLVLDLPNNPTGERLFPLLGPRQQGREKERGLVLWMNDHQDDFWGGPIGFGHDEPGEAIQQNLHANVSVEESIGRFMIPTRFALEGRTVAVPVAVFQVRVKSEHEDQQRPPDGDLYTVLFSPAMSEVLVEHVFLPNSISVRVVALQRQGGLSAQHRKRIPYPACDLPAMQKLSDFMHYRTIPELLREHNFQIGTYLVDNIAEIEGYHSTDNAMPHWGFGGTKMWVKD